MAKYLSGKSKLTPLTGLSSDRYRYLSLADAEPSLGDPLVGPSSIGAKPLQSGFQYQIVAVEGRPGERYWQPVQAQQVIPGSISVFEEGTLVGGVSSTTQLDFRGTAITASGMGGVNPGYAVTITFAPPGNNTEVIFKGNDDFATDSSFTFDSSINLLAAGDRLTVGAGGTVITTLGIGSVGIGTTDPVSRLHVEGDLKLSGTIVDRLGNSGESGYLLVKEADVFGGVKWTNPNAVRSGAGGTFGQIQYHGSTELVEGADFFYYDEVNNFVGIGSTQPTVRLDVIGTSNFDGDIIVERNLSVGGISTFTGNIDANGDLDVDGQTDLDNLNVSGTTNFTNTTNNTLGNPNSGAVQIDGGVGINQNVSIGGGLDVDGNTTLDDLTTSGTANFTSTTNNTLGNPNTGAVQVDGGVGINGNVSIGGGLDVDGNTTLDDLTVDGTATIPNLVVTDLQLRNLKVTGIGTFDQQVNINNLSVTGVATVDNIKLDTNTVSTLIGNLILDSSAGTTQLNDALYVNDATESTNKDTGSVIVEGGVGIEKRLNVGGAVSLATQGGITTTGGDLYVGGDLYADRQVTGDIVASSLLVQGITTTYTLYVGENPTVGISTILDEDNMISDRADALATQQSIKAYVDNQVGNQDLDFVGDNGVPGAVDLDTQVFDIGGVTGDIKTTSSGQSLTIESDVTGVVAGTYGSATRVGIITVNDKGKITAASDVAIDFSQANVETANRLNTPRTISFSEDVVAVGKTFDGSQNVGFALTLASIFDGGTYGGEGDKVLSLTVDDKGRITGITSVAIDFGLANVATADSLTNARQIAATGDIDWSVSFKGHEDVSGIATLATVNSDVGTFGSETQIPVITVDAKGRITGVGLTDVDDGDGSAAQADRVSTGTTTGTGDYFLTFVDSNNDPTRSAEYLYTDAEIKYNPNTDTLKPTNITVSTLADLQGNVNLGDSSADTLIVNASVGSTIAPDTTDFYDLGSSALLRWKTVYAETICADNYCGISGGGGAADQISVGSTDGNQEPYYMTFVPNTSGTQNLYTDAGLRYYPTTDELALDSNLLVCDNKTICIGDSQEFGLTYCIGNFAYDCTVVCVDACCDALGGSAGVSSNRYDVSGNKITSKGKGAIFEEIGDGPVLFRALGSGEGAFQFFSTDSNDSGCSGCLQPEKWVSLLKMHGGKRGFRLFQKDGNLEVVNITGAGVTVAGNIVPWVGANPQDDGARIGPIGNCTSGTFDLGSSTKRWGNVYANNFVGSITGNADTVSTACTNTGGTYYATFVKNSPSSPGVASTVYTDGGLVYEPSTNTLNPTNLEVANEARVCGILTVGTTSITLNGTTNTITVGTGVTISETTSSFNNVSAQTITPKTGGNYNLGASDNKFDTIFATNICGTNLYGTFSGTAASADQVKTQCNNTNGTYYLTFVDSDNSSATSETEYTTCDIQYFRDTSRKYFRIGTTYVHNRGGSSPNTIIGGSNAGCSLTTGNRNVIIGDNTGQKITTGYGNIAIGPEAGTSPSSSGTGNGTAFTGTSNIMLGYYTGGALNAGSYNALIGQSAGENVTSGGYNVFLGLYAGRKVNSGSYNTFVGRSAGCTNTGGSYNTYLGVCAGGSANGGNSNVAVGRYSGADALYDIGSNSNKVVIGYNGTNAAYVKVAWTTGSDIRCKCVWGDVPHGREFLRGVNPIKYSFKDEDTNEIIDESIRYGFSAQEILALEGNEPVIASNKNPDLYTITSDHMIPVLVNAIKELDTENTELKQRIVAIEQHLGL